MNTILTNKVEEEVKIICKICKNIHTEDEIEECEFCNYIGCNECIKYDNINNYLCHKCLD